MGENLGTSVKGENPAALPGKVLPAPDPDGSRKFHKRHDNVMQAISNLLKNKEIENRNLFHISHYMDSKGRTYEKYIMNRKGFTILVMGFNGKDAMHWKLPS